MTNTSDRKRGIPSPRVSGRQLRSTLPVTPKLLERMVRAIVDEVDPEKVILFGSRGRGDAGADSDVDLLVVEAEPFGPDRNKHREMLRLNRAVRDFRVPKDILVFSNEAMDYWRDSLNYVLARALREGRSCTSGPRAAMSTSRPGRALRRAPKELPDD